MFYTVCGVVSACRARLVLVRVGCISTGIRDFHTSFQTV